MFVTTVRTDTFSAHSGTFDAYGFPFLAPDEPRWFCLRALPSHERCVELLLSAKGVTHYCPRYLRATRRTDRPHLTTHPPLFPGYVLARFAWDNRKYATDIVGLQRTPILQFGNVPAVLTEDEVQQIRIMQENNAVPWERPIVAGDKVEIFSGKYAGISGTVQHVGDELYLVSFIFFNRPIAAPIDRDHVRIAA